MGIRLAREECSMKDKKLSIEEIDKRTKTRRKNGWFKDLKERKKFCKENYIKIPRCPKCNCFLSKNKKHNCKEIWERISTKFNKGRLNPNKNKTYKEIYGEEKSYKLREKLSKSHPSEKSYFRMGGISNEPYGKEFNDMLREQIRKRDNFQCKECLIFENQLGYTFSIHHIDYNKKNSKSENLITLCRKCHNKTNFNRIDWTNYFKNKMKENRNE
jgi:hypothetical protein